MTSIYVALIIYLVILFAVGIYRMLYNKNRISNTHGRQKAGNHNMVSCFSF